MFDKHLSELVTPESISLDISGLPRGVDNYHIDVKLSPTFCNDFQALLRDYLALETSQKEGKLKNEALKEKFKENYADMITVLINRVKTDLSNHEITLLQFSIYRYILESTRNALNEYLASLRSKLTDSKSGKSLGIQDQIVWVSKHYNIILYAINRHFFILLRQVESKVLHSVRRQFLGPEDDVFLDVFFNPLLLTSDLDNTNFLIEKYLLWNRSSDTSDFPNLNFLTENIFRELLPEAPFQVLKEEHSGSQLEIYDDLGGFAASNHLLGPSIDQKNTISETFSWLDDPANITHLFDESRHLEIARTTRQNDGLRAWWHTRGNIKRLQKILKSIKKMLEDKKLLKQLSASHHSRKIWSRHMAQHMEPISLCRYLAGEITMKEFEKRLLRGYQFSPAEIREMIEAAKTVEAEVTDKDDEEFVRFLSLLAQYRKHLKYFRFAHRVFNRIHILDDEEKLRLSSQAGTLYQVPMASEVTDGENRIVHHAILKADVRGSTTVTDELEKKGLNPASYFSLRFFSPINEVLHLYGANKVFIEGDSVILSFLEYEHNPQHWFSVAHACGMAKAMLSVVRNNNKYSSQMGLPPIELGIGVCYADYAPRYLYDGETPIMISSAIGDADRMSSCSWKLRAVIKKHPFNVEVMEIADDDASKGEKGQQKIRYNVNGILLDNVGFEKLKQEMVLTRVTGQIEGQACVFFYGEYPDTEGKKRNLVIREGTVGLWKNDAIHPNDTDEKFYEVVTNPQITAGIQKKLQAARADKNPAPAPDTGHKPDI